MPAKAFRLGACGAAAAASAYAPGAVSPGNVRSKFDLLYSCEARALETSTRAMTHACCSDIALETFIAALQVAEDTAQHSSARPEIHRVCNPMTRHVTGS